MSCQRQETGEFAVFSVFFTEAAVSLEEIFSVRDWQRWGGFASDSGTR
jgi:hypothetical protein